MTPPSLKAATVERDSMGYDKTAPGEVGSAVDEDTGGMWFMREPLDTTNLGFTVIELEPDHSTQEHEHGDENEEEIYFVIDGRVQVDVHPDTVTLDENEAIRIDPEERRQIHNREDRTARLVLVSAPTDIETASSP